MKLACDVVDVEGRHVGRASVLLLIAILCLGAEKPCGAPGFRVNEHGVKGWTAPSRGWEVFGMERFVVGGINELLSKVPAGVDVFRVFERVVGEKGEWLSFGVKFCEVHRVVFTKRTKIVLIDKAGRRVESEAVVFWRDAAQTEVFDSSERPVVVSADGVYCFQGTRRPWGAAKFAAGSFVLSDVVAFEVVGAVEQRDDGGPK